MTKSKVKEYKVEILEMSSQRHVAFKGIKLSGLCSQWTLFKLKFFLFFSLFFCEYAWVVLDPRKRVCVKFLFKVVSSDTI